VSHLAEVVTLREDCAADIVDCLHKSADAIAAETEDHDRTRAVIAVHVTASGRLRIYGMGAIDTIDTIAHLALAQAQLMRDRMNELDQ
jgi:hypothetical protein